MKKQIEIYTDKEEFRNRCPKGTTDQIACASTSWARSDPYLLDVARYRDRQAYYFQLSVLEPEGIKEIGCGYIEKEKAVVWLDSCHAYSFDYDWDECFCVLDIRVWFGFQEFIEISINLLTEVKKWNNIED